MFCRAASRAKGTGDWLRSLPAGRQVPTYVGIPARRDRGLAPKRYASSRAGACPRCSNTGDPLRRRPKFDHCAWGNTGVKRGQEPFPAIVGPQAIWFRSVSLPYLPCGVDRNRFLATAVRLLPQLIDVTDFHKWSSVR
jgi:hypothetical protein